jgi:hypothetical protein
MPLAFASHYTAFLSLFPVYFPLHLLANSLFFTLPARLIGVNLPTLMFSLRFLRPFALSAGAFALALGRDYAAVPH